MRPPEHPPVNRGGLRAGASTPGSTRCTATVAQNQPGQSRRPAPASSQSATRRPRRKPLASTTSSTANPMLGIASTQVTIEA
jgi:hypothetical protein